MSFKTLLFVAAITGSIFGITGCKDKDLDKAAYEASDEHCKPDYLKSLPDSEARESLLENCMTRGSYSTSKSKTW